MGVTALLMQERVPVTVLQTHGDPDASNSQEVVTTAKEAYEAGWDAFHAIDQAAIASF